MRQLRSIRTVAKGGIGSNSLMICRHLAFGNEQPISTWRQYLRPWVSRQPQSSPCARVFGIQQHHRVFPTLHRHRRKLPSPMRRAASSRRWSGRKELISSFIQRQINFDNVGDRLVMWRLLAVFCNQLRGLFNAEPRAFAARGICGYRDVIVQPACRYRHQFNRNIRLEVSGPYPRVRLLIYQLRLRPPDCSLLLLDNRHFCRCRRTCENSRCPENSARLTEPRTVSLSDRTVGLPEKPPLLAR